MLVFSHNTIFIEANHSFKRRREYFSVASLRGKSITMLSLYLLLRHEDRMNGCILIIRKWRVINDGPAKSLVHSPEVLMIGWADATRKELRDIRPPLEQASVEKIIAACLIKIGEVAFSNAYDEGQKMSMGQAVTFALDENLQTVTGHALPVTVC